MSDQKSMIGTQVQAAVQQATNIAMAQVTTPVTAAQQAQMIQQWTTPMTSTLTGTNYTITTTGDSPSYQREYEVSRIVKRAKNGYFFVITVDAADDVFYRVWRGGWFPYVVAKVFKRFGADIDGTKGSWNTVTKRSHLPATLGAAYEKVDEAIKDDIEFEEHEEYVKDLLTTKPENLKMISGLEKLAEGDVDAKDTPDANPNTGSSNNVGISYSNNVSVSGGASAYIGPGSNIPFTSSYQAGTLTGVSTLEAEKIILNGTDIAETISENIKEATDKMILKLVDLEADVKEVSAP